MGVFLWGESPLYLVPVISLGVIKQRDEPPSGGLQLDLRVDRQEFGSGIVDFHLPVDSALRVIDVGRPRRRFFSKFLFASNSTTGNTLTSQAA
jgi:hypothetical protein